MRRWLTRRWRVLLGVCLALGSCALFSSGQGTDRAVLVLPIQTVKGGLLEGEMIDEGLAAFFERALGAVNPDEIAAVVIDMNTFGGRVDSAIRIADAIESCEREKGVRVAVFINNKAISAGSLISICCDRIYMMKGGTIGASTPVTFGAEGMTAADEKVMSFVAA